ncbi:hypothetical protein G7Y89_g12146 [Cudoniella acicularis]|uniref:Isochorismatase-like domain-containing protein n=1 Tax=Cudoniella acicularis TaxID=354080 RepID=A0A8H4RC44_9HELO|nr:hypothetical protein G7Y89_g12146 [Cudoniella acicularis]
MLTPAMIALILIENVSASLATKLYARSRPRGIQVIHCLVDTNAIPPPTCKDTDRLVSVVGARKSSGGEEPAELLEGGGDDDVTFTKRPGYASALKSPSLNDFLQTKDIKSLILTGLSMSVCVLRITITASDEKYVVTVISDGCADPAEGVHDIIVGKVLNNRGYVATAAEFQEGFANEK